MNQLKVVFFFILFFSTLKDLEADYKFDGLYPLPDGERRLFLTTFFLPYNPSVVIWASNRDLIEKSAYWWPKGTCHFSSFESLEGVSKCDFLWIDGTELELELLEKNAACLNQIHVIYTPTHFSNDGDSYRKLRSFLEQNNFSLLSHWYWEGLEGNAIFVRNDTFSAAMKSLNYHPTGSQLPFEPRNYELERFFKKAENKAPHYNNCDQIDHIYMINLDERPEKFNLAAADLYSYGIYPYRFSAVNGWKLPKETIDQIGVKFHSDMTDEKFIGTIYKEIDNQEYISNECIQNNGETYFCLGMSRGSIGIVLSHLSVLKDAYDSGYHTIWVMEDDVEAVRDPRVIPELIKKLDRLAPDWDILFTDTDTKDSQGNHIPCRALAARPNFNMETLSAYFSRFYSIDNDFSRIAMRYGAYSMIIRRSGVKKILDHFNSYGVYLPYDMDFWLIPDIKMYSVAYDIVSHRAGSLTDNHAPGYETNP